MTDLYALLGVGQKASQPELRRAYQRLARLLHPAVNPADPVSAERFRLVSDAFAVLSDPERRARYDRGEPLSKQAETSPEVGFEGFDFSAEVSRVRAGFREIFDGLLPGDPVADAPCAGEDLEQVTRIDFLESLRGAARRVHLVRFDACTVCGGTGDASFGPVACARCKGSGHLRASRGHLVFKRSCSDCGGRGILRRPCVRCEGEGRVRQSEWLEVEIPKGVASGSRVRVPGAGNAGRRGGRPGDLVLIVEVEPHEHWKRDGDDLICQVPITLAQAAGGGHVEVKTPDGAVTIEIPAGTQPGQRFRLRKRGVPQLGGKGRGDLYVEARLVVPTVTDERGRALLQELARMYPQGED